MLCTLEFRLDTRKLQTLRSAGRPLGCGLLRHWPHVQVVVVLSMPVRVLPMSSVTT